MPAAQRIAIAPRTPVRCHEPSTPAYWDLSRLSGKWYFPALHWLLQKLGAVYRERVPGGVRTEEWAINHADIQATIRGSQSAVRALWDKQATTLLVGHDEMARLTPEAPTEYATFNTRVPIGYGDKSRYMGLRVVCVPWLQGWALLPDLDKE